MNAGVLFGVLVTLLNKGKVTIKELSMRFELSPRTISRYIDALDVAGVPVITYPGRGGGVGIADNFLLDRVYLTEKERERLLQCVSGMEGIYDDEVSSALKEKLQHLSSGDFPNVLATDTVLIDSGPWGDVKAYRDKFRTLQRAINERKEAEIVYHDRDGNETVRVVHAYTLVFKTGLWYSYCYCKLRKQFRLFKIGRIARIKLLETSFERQPLEVDKLPYKLNWFEAGGSVNVTLEVDCSIKSEIEEWLSFENVKEINGKIYAFARLPEEGLVQKLLSYGNKVKVIEPQSLRQKMLNTVEGIKEMYEGLSE